VEATEPLAPHWCPLVKGAAVPVPFCPWESVMWAEGVV